MYINQVIDKVSKGFDEISKNLNKINPFENLDKIGQDFNQMPDIGQDFSNISPFGNLGSSAPQKGKITCFLNNNFSYYSTNIKMTFL